MTWLFAYYAVVVIGGLVVAVLVERMFSVATSALDIVVLGTLAIGTAAGGILLAERIRRERL